MTDNYESIAVLPLRDIVVFPSMIVPLFVGRDKSVKALDAAMENDDKKILLVAQKQSTEDDPSPDDLYSYGTVGSILQILKLPDGTVKVLVEGFERARITKIADGETWTMPATIDDPVILKEIEEDLRKNNILK